MSHISFTSYPLNRQELDALRQGDFEVHFIHATIKQQRNNNPEIYSGPSYIRQAKDGGFEVRLYASKQIGSTSEIDFITQLISRSPGEVIPEEDFYTFSGVDGADRTWESDPFLIGVDNTVGPGAFVTSIIRQVSCSKELNRSSDQDVIILRVFQEIEIPYNTMTESTSSAGNRQSSSTVRNALAFSACACDFFLQTQDNTLLVHAQSRNQLFLEHFETRIIEALQFVTAQPLEWSVLTKRQGKKAYSQIVNERKIEAKGHTKPPLSSRVGNEVSFCEMFNKYLAFIYNFEGRNLHPISAQIRAVTRASQSYFNTEALVLSVAIESIVQDIDVTLRKLTREEKRWLKKARKYFETWEGPEHLTNRILGLCGMISDTSTSARLKQLISLGAITEIQFKAWKRLRNMTAHGDDNSLSEIPIQELFLLCDTALVTLYHLVFFIIGYSGLYTNYERLGWPNEKYQHPSTIDAVRQITESS